MFCGSARALFWEQSMLNRAFTFALVCLPVCYNVPEQVSHRTQPLSLALSPLSGLDNFSGARSGVSVNG